jgi:hypothetical protein
VLLQDGPYHFFDMVQLFWALLCRQLLGLWLGSFTDSFRLDNGYVCLRRLLGGLSLQINFAALAGNLLRRDTLLPAQE